MINSTVELSNDTKLQIFKDMLTSRYGDLREQRLIRQGKGWFHVSGMGHEAMGAITHFLSKDDYLFPFYRDRGLVTARGVTAEDLALSFYAKKGSSSDGKQLPGHYCSRDLNIWSVASPIALHLLPAVGAAWGMQMDGKDKDVVITCVGDGGTRQGDFFEAVCFAKEKKLPVVFIVQDNGVAISTRTDSMTVMALEALKSEDWKQFDGTNVYEVYEHASEAIEHARSGKGPAFLWANVERLSSHSSADDHRNYRSTEEIEEMSERDPVTTFRKILIDEGVASESELEAIEKELEAQVRSAYNDAEKAKDPKPGEEMKEVLGPIRSGKAPTLSPGEEYRMADAVNIAFKNALETNVDTCFFGEDIEDPLGGVFKLTKGLSTEFPGRVVNSPLAESSIMGIACGLASYGKKPIFEMQFVDFLSPGWNQLVNNLSTLRWRSHGQWTCPAIIYAPSGGYLPGGGIWHSQSNESYFAHTPGLIVLMPSTPEDAAGLLSSALACEDPVMFLIPKHMLWAGVKTPNRLEAVPIGKAAVRQEGNDVTVVSWGNGMEVCEDTLKELGKKYSVELIDLRSIYPWDKETIFESLSKTRRLVVVQEDTENCSVGQMIITEISKDPKLWESLLAAPTLVSKGNVQIGYNPIYEYSALPTVNEVSDAIKKAVSTSTKRSFERGPEIEEKPEPGMEHAHGGGIGARVGDDFIVKLPNLGEGLREARVVEVFKKEGDTVEQDDSLCEVETDKAVFPVESSVSGTLKEWYVKEGDLIEVGKDIAVIGGVAGGVAEDEEIVGEADNHLTDHGALSDEILKQLEGVLPAALGVEAKWKPLRDAWGSVRGRSEKGAFSYTTMVAWAVVQAMKEHEAFRRLLRNGRASKPQETFDIGFAVALDNDELETAVIEDAGSKSWSEFVEAYREGLRKVREGIPQSKARTSMLLTSMGPLKIRNGNPIVVPPAMATLFLGEPHFEVTADGSAEEVVALDFSFDHRWANGAGAGRFLKAVKDNLENFDTGILK